MPKPDRTKEKAEIAAYLASLAALINIKEDVGREDLMRVLNYEFDRGVALLTEIVNEDMKETDGR